MRKYLINGIGRTFCFPLYKEVKVMNNKLKYKHKRLRESGQENESVTKSENIIWKNNNIERRRVKFNSNDEFEFKSSCTLKNYSTNYKKIRKTNPFSFEELNTNLELMLSKLQKCFNPNLLKDEDLKFEIIKEIVECQRLLLISNMHQKNSNETLISMNEIYDEWYNFIFIFRQIYFKYFFVQINLFEFFRKTLAMVVDRICFFFYLFALLLSATIFFVREET